MTITRMQARKLANWLKELNDSGMSFRKIAELFPRRADGSQIVKAGTIDRIAKTEGDYLPQDREILEALGLLKPRAVRIYLPGEMHINRIIGKMARELEQSISSAWRS